MVALKEPHLAELGWHDESQQGSVGQQRQCNVPVQRFLFAGQAPGGAIRYIVCTKLCVLLPNLTFIHICRLQSW